MIFLLLFYMLAFLNYKDTRSSLQSLFLKNKPNCKNSHTQVFNHIFLLMSRKNFCVANEMHVLDQWEVFSHSCMVIISFHFLLQSLFFHGGNSIVCGGNSWCPYQNSKYRSNQQVLVFPLEQNRIYNLVPFSLPTFMFFSVWFCFWTVFLYAALSPPYAWLENKQKDYSSFCSAFHVVVVFIGPESDHWECLSVTDSLTH